MQLVEKELSFTKSKKYWGRMGRILEIENTYLVLKISNVNQFGYLGLLLRHHDFHFHAQQIFEKDTESAAYQAKTLVLPSIFLFILFVMIFRMLESMLTSWSSKGEERCQF